MAGESLEMDLVTVPHEGLGVGNPPGGSGGRGVTVPHEGLGVGPVRHGHVEDLSDRSP